LSVLCVEMMPTLAALMDHPTPAAAASVSSSLFSAVFAEQAGMWASSARGSTAADVQTRPLSDGLGHYRILRTSPLTEIVDVCCGDC
jgi:hypothetical protein